MSKCFLAWFLCVSSVLHCWLVQSVSPTLVFVIGPDPNMDKQFKKARLYETGCSGKKRMQRENMNMLDFIIIFHF